MSASPASPLFMRPAEAAALAGLSTGAIYRAIGRGVLRAVRLCSRLRIPRDAFEAWVASSAGDEMWVAIAAQAADGRFADERRALPARLRRRRGRALGAMS